MVNLLQVLDLQAVIGCTFDVLAANAAASALSSDLVPGRNRLRSVLLDPAERALYRGRDATMARFVARETEVAVFDHPVVGLLRLPLERLDVPGTAGQGLVAHHPEAGSDDAARLAGLRPADHR